MFPPQYGDSALSNDRLSGVALSAKRTLNDEGMIPPRHQDRNCTIVQSVLQNMECLSDLYGVNQIFGVQLSVVLRSVIFDGSGCNVQLF